jgi:hypothetical protein
VEQGKKKRQSGDFSLALKRYGNKVMAAWPACCWLKAPLIFHQRGVSMSDAGSPPAAKGISGLGIASLVLGAVSLACAYLLGCLGFVIAIPVGLVGLILGIIGAAGSGGGKPISILGVLLSLGSMVLAVYWWYAFGSAVADVGKKLYEEHKKTFAEAPSATVSELVKTPDKYKMKPVKITGKLADIKTDVPLNATATLKGDGTDSIKVVFFPWEKDTLKTKKDGDTVTVAGTVIVNNNKPELDAAVFP